ncbi:helix-turn-helix transcriptional regulator [Schaedlerella arabinosiphila]|uniref:Helix-turn-helix transcriptional regulator n=1 Tax=Schaedlerella arabinosiphila TaxID=2044587 RepID=A0A9X5H6D3_9FIRM|nr:helix-turn-helix transcriptional regulator [Schaedlerella arabinosiphila]
MPVDLDYKELGKRIKEQRLKQHLTQEKLGEIVGVNTSNISHIERAATQVSLSSLVKIANALDTTLDCLVCDSLCAVADLYIEQDISNLLQGCTLAEKQIIKDILITTKKTLKEHR